MLLVWLFLTAILVVGVAVAWQIATSKKFVTLRPSLGVTATFGVPKDSENESTLQKIILTTTSQTRIKIKKGFYMVRFSQPGRVPQYQYLHLKTDTTITSPQMPYVQASLNEMLETKKSAIDQQLASNPATSNYTPGYQQLYNIGTWFAATLRPTNTSDAERRIILHKVDGGWTVAAGPEQSFYIGEYPSIPQNVIRDINNH
jgi:hypothetical protein